jgi:hypothetical protein
VQQRYSPAFVFTCGTSLHSTRCADFWRPDGAPGKECSPCPDGGICDGQLNLPYPDDSFWGASSLTAANESVLTVYNSTQQGPYFFACRTCTGKFTCQQGYTGTLCMSCVPGQFSWGGSCKIACADIEPQGPVSVLTILAVVAVWIVSSCPSCIDFDPELSCSLQEKGRVFISDNQHLERVRCARSYTRVCCTPLSSALRGTAWHVGAVSATCRLCRRCTNSLARTRTAVPGTQFPMCSECCTFAGVLCVCVCLRERV